jgi:integrase
MAPSPAQRQRRLEAVSVFARHVRVEDSRHEIPPAHFFGRVRQHFTPFLFTPAQLRQLLEHAARLGPEGSLRPWTYCTLFSLIAVSGLRISEALALALQDITPDGLLIRETKFRKSRLVPLHPTTTVGLERYLDHRCRLGGADEHVFVSLRGRVLAYPTVISVFLTMAREIGLHPGAGHPGPRIHDLRHTFAVRSLEACPFGRDQVEKHMLALATYMGHAKLVSSYWYLRATPQMLADIAAVCERTFPGGAQ